MSVPASAVATCELPASEIEREILARLGGRIHGLEVMLCAEGAVLRGRVRSFHVKQLAQQTVMELGQLVHQNAIEVQ